MVATGCFNCQWPARHMVCCKHFTSDLSTFPWQGNTKNTGNAIQHPSNLFLINWLFDWLIDWLINFKSPLCVTLFVPDKWLARLKIQGSFMGCVLRSYSNTGKWIIYAFGEWMKQQTLNWIARIFNLSSKRTSNVSVSPVEVIGKISNCQCFAYFLKQIVCNNTF